MNVLVTGANGFIGSNLCKSLIRSGQSVVGLVRESGNQTFLQDIDNLQLVYGDITAKDSLAAAMQDVAVVYNVAGLAADWGPWEVFRNVNVAGVRNVMETALQHGVRRVVHISSVSIQKAKSELGYHPAVSTRDGIRKTIQWYHNFTNPPEDDS
jgi:nucleoside-diphosphate-sugar epimerase